MFAVLRDQQRCAEADRDPHIFGIPGGTADLSQRKSCGRCIVGTLTNKANIKIYIALLCRYRLSTD